MCQTGHEHQGWPPAWDSCPKYLLTRCWPLKWTGPDPAFRRKTAGGVTVNPPRQTCNAHITQHEQRQQYTMATRNLESRSESGREREDERWITHTGQSRRLQWDQNGLYFLALRVLSFHLNHVEFIFCIGVHTGLEKGGGKKSSSWYMEVVRNQSRRVGKFWMLHVQLASWSTQPCLWVGGGETMSQDSQM